jgi:hypothetical protein
MTYGEYLRLRARFSRDGYLGRIGRVWLYVVLRMHGGSHRASWHFSGAAK